MSAGVKLLAAAAAVCFVAVAAPGAMAAEPQGSDQQHRIRIDVDPLQPQLVTADKPDTLTVTGRLTNVGDRTVNQLDVRLERGIRLTGDSALRDALRGPGGGSALWTDFHDPVSLTPGQSSPFTLRVTVHGVATDSLRINEPGVYPLMVNANGTPDYGQRSKVGQATTLLPVLSVPGEGAPATTKPPAPAALTVLWPLTDRPRLLSDLDGGQSTTPLLADDGLAAAMAAGGRLDALVTAAQNAPAPLAPAMCFAIDPDLLATARAMTGNYQVLDVNGQPSPGRSQGVAKTWLERVRQLVRDRCVFALPFADTDLTALSAMNAGVLVTAAVADTSDSTIHDVLDVAPVQHLVWPINGGVDDRTLTRLTGRGVDKLVVSSADVPGSEPVPPGTPIRLGSSSGPLAVVTDDVVSIALSGGSGAVPSALSAVAMRAGPVAAAGRSLIVAPPHQWTASAGAASALLNGLQELVSLQYLTPVPLASSITPPSTTARVMEPHSVPPSIPASADVQRAAVAAGDLLDSMEQDPSS
ncbi:MAG: hypothetical protein JOZ47_07110, partial [Kutzneria sp.]|nr:hypothetical protein [Kutzneria sp.]